MSILRMTKTCIYCHLPFSYNPSVGDMGLVCPYCGESQSLLRKYLTKGGF